MDAFRNLVTTIAFSTALLSAPVLATGSNSASPVPNKESIGGATAPNARMAAWIIKGGTVGRSKGLEKLKHPAPGIYCLKVAGKKFDASTAIASTSLEWSASFGFKLVVMWLQSTVNCPNSRQWIEVVTYDFSSGTAVLSDNAGFSIVVP